MKQEKKTICSCRYEGEEKCSHEDCKVCRPDVPPTQEHIAKGEWGKRGYRVTPTSLEDIALDYEGTCKAEKENVWVLEIREDEAKLFLKQAIQEAIAGEREKIPAQAIKRLAEFSDPSEISMTYSVYISPAQRLRQQADQLEQRQRDYQEVVSWLASLTPESK